MAITIDQAINRTKQHLEKKPDPEGEKFLEHLLKEKDRGLRSISFTPMPRFLLEETEQQEGQ